MAEWIGGKNAVYELLKAGRRRPRRLLIAQGAQVKGRLAEIVSYCEREGIPIERSPRKALDARDISHQGVAIETSEYPYSSLADILEFASLKAELPFVLILDALQDPQNLGTLLRTSEAVGVHGVILPLRRTALVTPAVVRTSSGASEHLLIAQSNLAQAIGLFKEADIWVYGLERGPKAVPAFEARFDLPLAVVVGNEAQGLRPLVRRSCDQLVGLPMRGRLESLNAAVAGSLVLYLAWQARGYAGGAIDGRGDS